MNLTTDFDQLRNISVKIGYLGGLFSDLLIVITGEFCQNRTKRLRNFAYFIKV